MIKLISAIPYWVWLLASVITFACGEFLSKKTALNPSLKFIILTVAVYAAATLLWLPALIKRNELAVVGSIWSVGSLLATVFIGTMLFGEHLNWQSIVGIVLGAASVALLSLSG